MIYLLRTLLEALNHERFKRPLNPECRGSFILDKTIRAGLIPGVKCTTDTILKEKK